MGKGGDTATCVDILLAIILPPLGVFFKFGCKVSELLALLHPDLFSFRSALVVFNLAVPRLIAHCFDGNFCFQSPDAGGNKSLCSLPCADRVLDLCPAHFFWLASWYIVRSLRVDTRHIGCSARSIGMEDLDHV